MNNSSTPNKIVPSFKKSRLFRSSPSPNSTFKSPLISENRSHPIKTDMPIDELKTAAECVWKETESLKNEIDDLEKQGYKVEEVKWYIDKMHSYNEIKDAAQVVIGRIAILECKTVKTVHEEFGLSEED